MAKIGEMLGLGGNQFYDLFASNRQALAGAFGGAAANPGNPWGGASQGVALGQQQDDAYATQQKADAERQQQLADATALKDKYVQFFTQQNQPQYAQAVADGIMEPGAAYGDWMKAQAGGQGDMSGTSQGRAKLAEQYGLQGDAAQAYILTGKLPGANDSSKYGNSPIYARDAQGNYIAVQPGSDGSTNVMQFPDGFRPDPGALNSDRAAGTAYGSAQGAMQFNLPAAKQNVEAELANIQSLKSDTQGIEETFGKVGGIWPQQWSPVIPQTKRADYAARLEQVQGQNFLQAFTTLKGAGAITEQEGAKAQAAMARLSQNQSKEAYLQSLDDLEQILMAGYQRMSGQAGAGAYQSGTGAADGAPNIDDLLTKYGQ